MVVKGRPAPCSTLLAVLGRWVTHALIYLSACSSASLVWVMLTDSTVDDLKDFARTPGNALTLDFFPVWFWLLWGTALAFHGAVVIGRLMPGSRRRRRRQRAMQTPTGVRHIVAMFTDLSGSTGTNERLGDDAWAALVTEHRRMVRGVTAEHGGKEVSTQGDGFFVRFDDPGSAAACAVALQELCKIERSSGSELPPIRIGIHQGDAVHDHDDVLGQVVTVAARLLEIAKPHEILLTEPVADGVAAERLDDRGLVTLKGVSQPRHVLALRWDRDAPKRSGEIGRRPTRRDSSGDR
ncbi:MAG: class 3 adenylate cyclase [Candidatus Aldehydirespiratoraceae bacterium]